MIHGHRTVEYWESRGKDRRERKGIQTSEKVRKKGRKGRKGKGGKGMKQGNRRK